jgi:hypothetical protein
MRNRSIHEIDEQVGGCSLRRIPSEAPNSTAYFEVGTDLPKQKCYLSRPFFAELRRKTDRSYVR